MKEANGHSSNPNEIRKSLDDLSAPLAVEDPGGSGAGIRPQFPRLVFSASTQYLSPMSLPLSVLSAANLKLFAAFLSASSLPAMDNWALNAWTEGIGGSFETIVALKVWEVSGEAAGGWEGAVSRLSRSLACDISPNAMLHEMSLCVCVLRKDERVDDTL
jgi:hypothetical protein